MLQTTLSLRDVTHVIGPDRPTTIIGERINPTGRKALSTELEKGVFDLVRKEAISQKAAGAHVIDVNVGAGGVDDVTVLPQAVLVVVEAAGLPVSIDSSNPKAIESALKVYPGKALVNSVTGEEKSLETVLPMVKEYKAAVVGLTMDDTGIPPTAEDRLKVAEKIIDRAASMGIPAEDILIDPLTLTVATDPKAAMITLEAIRLCVSKLGVNVVLGASNVSYGLPARTVINAAFMSMAMFAGMSAAITNPGVQEVKKAILAGDVLLGRDQWAQRYIRSYREEQKAAEG
ncbi:MAG TPA: dihydropteroate synthase [Clostridia bacterium]|nr:dihydropteroate synthase [Clostridia bacterium]